MVSLQWFHYTPSVHSLMVIYSSWDSMVHLPKFQNNWSDSRAEPTKTLLWCSHFEFQFSLPVLILGHHHLFRTTDPPHLENVSHAIEHAETNHATHFQPRSTHSHFFPVEGCWWPTRTTISANQITNPVKQVHTTKCGQIHILIDRTSLGVSWNQIVDFSLNSKRQQPTEKSTL